MKKMLLLAVVAAVSVPLFAGDKYDGKPGPRHFGGPRHEMVQDPQLKAQMEAKKAEMKAREEKMEQLVKDFKKAKIGSKKQIAVRNEMTSLLGQIRDEQIAMREKKINEFEKRLADMKNRLAEEKTPETKEKWVTNMMDRVFESEGDLKEAFKRQAHLDRRAQKGHGRPFPDGPADDMLPQPPEPPAEK